MSRRILQVILAIIGLIVITGSLMSVITGASDKFYTVNMSNAVEGNIILDSNYRFFAGLGVGMGFIILWIIPSIEKHKIVLCLLGIMIFLGAIGRLLSIFTFGMSSIPFIIFTLLELFFPLLIFWQGKIAKSSA